jgi:GntR family transcriptional regulator/MocR family aminotransferase
VGTFSKTLFPSLRLGYIVCPPALREDLINAKRLADLGCAAIDQAALAAFFGSRQFERYLRQSVEELQHRREALLEGLRTHAGEHLEIVDSEAGMHVVGWLRNFSYPKFEQLIKLSEARGLSLRPIHPYYRRKPPDPGLLMGFANLPAQEADAASHLFGLCLAEVLRPSHATRP